MLKRNKLVAFFAVISMLLMTACGSTDTAKNEASSGNSSSGASSAPANIKLATNTQGSAWYVYGATMAELLRPVLSNSSVDVLPLAGGVGNAKMLKEGKADAALSFSITSKWAYDGNVAYQEKQEDLRGLVGSLDKYYIGVVASKEFVDKNAVKSVKDIIEKKLPVRIYTNNKGTLAEFSTSQVLQAYGVSYDDIKSFGGKVELTSNDVIKDAFQNGEADLHILVMPKSHPTISEIAVHTPIAFLPMEEETVKKFQEFGYQSGVLPGGIYKGQDSDVQTVSFSTMILTSSKLSDDIAYSLTKSIVEGKDKLHAAHDALKDFDPKNATELSVPLHPGAEKYYKEAGLLK